MDKKVAEEKKDEYKKIITPPSPSTNLDSLDDCLRHHDFFGLRNSFTMKEMFEARVHLGHKEGTLNNLMKPFIVGSRLGSLIIDLEKTKELLGDALNFTAHIASRGGIILFVNRSRQVSCHGLFFPFVSDSLPHCDSLIHITIHSFSFLQQQTGFLVEKLAKETGEYSQCHDFRGGIFSNPTVVFGSVTRLPDLVVFLNINNNVLDTHRGVKDAARLAIPTVGIVDTSCDPTFLTFPVPGNDDTPSSIEFYCKVFKQAVLAGKAKLQ